MKPDTHFDIATACPELKLGSIATSHPLPATASLCDAWPDAGAITMRGRVGALIALGAGFNPILTGLGARRLFPLTARCSGSRKRKLQLAFAFI